MTFNAIFIEKNDLNDFSCSLKEIRREELEKQDGNTLVKIQYSSLNYKDALALTNKAPIIRSWPMIPGVDGVGTVIEDKSNRYQKGDNVILNGWGCGETHWGCFGQYIYLKSDWLILLPKRLTPYQSMVIGTAGYTAGLCVQRILDANVKPEHGEILITGASGGVGSVALALLSKLGYKITASSHKENSKDYLYKLGASNVIDGQSLKNPGKPLQKECWSAVIDVLGAHTLVNACAQTKYGGIVTSCGLAQGINFSATVAPFILRGITLAGIDSVMADYDNRNKSWNLLSQYLDDKQLNLIGNTITLSDCMKVAKDMTNGNIQGRFVIDVNK